MGVLNQVTLASQVVPVATRDCKPCRRVKWPDHKVLGVHDAHKPGENKDKLGPITRSLVDRDPQTQSVRISIDLARVFAA